MKFKTTIQITTEAKDRDEAMDLAGEYLSGNLSGGVEMKFHTVPARNSYIKTSVLICALLAVVIVSVFGSSAKHENVGIQTIGYGNAIQPPLQTSFVQTNAVAFRNEWQTKSQTETLKSLKK